jgi:hypothetical protein
VFDFSCHYPTLAASTLPCLVLILIDIKASTNKIFQYKVGKKKKNNASYDGKGFCIHEQNIAHEIKVHRRGSPERSDFCYFSPRPSFIKGKNED